MMRQKKLSPKESLGKRIEFRDCMIREVRIQYQLTSEPAFKIGKPEEVAHFVRKILCDNSREHVIALFLDGAHQVAGYSIVSIGTATNALIHPREIFQRAIGAGAVAFVMAHNHPSGNTQPSAVNWGWKYEDAERMLSWKILTTDCWP